MVRPENIPADVWETATRFWREAGCSSGDQSSHARAILADRAGRLNTDGLTLQQAKCLRTIAAYQARTGVSPSYDDLADELGLGKTSAFRLVCGLADRGAVTIDAGRSRSITINPARRGMPLPA